MRRVRALLEPAIAQGADFSVVFSQSEPRRIISMVATLTAGVTVGNRGAAFGVKDVNGVTGFIAGANAPLAASSAQSYCVSTAFGTPQTGAEAGGPDVLMGIPDFVLPPGWAFFSLTNGILPVDQWSGLTFIVEQYDSWSENERAIVGAYERLLATGNAG